MTSSTTTRINSFRYSETGVFNLLKKYRFVEESVALLPQVASSTGAGAGRTADAIAMQLWPSRGLTIEGIEIKVDRRDWLRELEDPAKADVISAYCDKWWVVAPVGVVDLKKDDFPKMWGLLEIQQTKDWVIAKTDAVDEHQQPKWATIEEPVFKIVEKVKAPENPNAKEPNRGFLASLMRNLQRHVVNDEDQVRLLAEAEAKGRKSAEAAFTIKHTREAAEQKRLLGDVRDFEKATGLEVLSDSWRKESRLNGIGRRLALLQMIEEDATRVEVMMSDLHERAKSIQQAVESIHPVKTADRKEGFPFTMPSPFKVTK